MFAPPAREGKRDKSGHYNGGERNGTNLVFEHWFRVAENGVFGVPRSVINGDRLTYAKSLQRRIGWPTLVLPREYFSGNMILVTHGIVKFWNQSNHSGLTGNTACNQTKEGGTIKAPNT